MHPVIAQELARGRIADFHHEAARTRRLHGPQSDEPPTVRVETVSAVHVPDPTRLVRRLLGRLRPAVAP
jgi:hypothetical protein